MWPARPRRTIGGSLLAATILAGCGAAEDQASGPGQTTVTTGAQSTATTPTEPGPTVGRPGPPDAARCGVSIADPAPRPGATITAKVLSGLAEATFLARIFDASTSTTASGTTDASGAGSVQLRVPGPPANGPVEVEVSIAGGGEACTTSFKPS